MLQITRLYSRAAREVTVSSTALVDHLFLTLSSLISDIPRRFRHFRNAYAVHGYLNRSGIPGSA